MSGTHHNLLERLRDAPEFWTERLVSEYVHELARVMHDNDINRNQLAERAGVARSFITRVLSGNANVTTNTMAKLAHALDSKVCVHIAPKAARVHFMEAYDGYSWVASLEPSISAVSREKSDEAETKEIDIPVWG